MISDEAIRRALLSGELGLDLPEESSESDAGQVASPFRLAEDGVYFDAEDKALRLCGRLEVVARSRSVDSEEWGLLLRWADDDGIEHSWLMPSALLAGEPNEYRSRLASGGLFLAPGRKERDLLARYLLGANPSARARSVHRIGWHEDAFVLPGEAFGGTGGERFVYQGAAEAEHLFRERGSLEDWRANVGTLCSGNSRLLLAVSAAFAGPLLRLMGSESGGLHFHGATSSGKSTALLVAGSVCGGGGRNGFVQTWRATANGLEATAEAHNDCLLLLDELAQVDPKEAADIAYLLGNGAGKSRMTKTTGSRRKLQWTLFFVSTGELTLADHAQSAGRKTKGGVDVRLLNIEADAGAGLGLFENLHGYGTPDAFARGLKANALALYGTPLRAFLRHVTANAASLGDLCRRFKETFIVRFVPAEASGEVRRAADRLAVLAAAGEIATEQGITGWRQGEALEAAGTALASWVDLRGTVGAVDMETAVRQVQAFIETHGASRFQTLRPTVVNQEAERIINRAGFKRLAEDGPAEFWILPETFRREVCAGFDHRKVAKALTERGLLDRQPPDLTKRVRVPELGLQRVYVVRLHPAEEGNA